MFVATLYASLTNKLYVGFGDGLKSAAVSLMADSSKFKLLQFEFLTQDHIISWNFKRRPLEGIRLCIYILNIQFAQYMRY
jgi:hypothetical protein